jgi:hypothetical protein
MTSIQERKVPPHTVEYAYTLNITLGRDEYSRRRMPGFGFGQEYSMGKIGV